MFDPRCGCLWRLFDLVCVSSQRPSVILWRWGECLVLSGRAVACNVSDCVAVVTLSGVIWLRCPLALSSEQCSSSVGSLSLFM